MITNQVDKASYAGNGSNVNFTIPFTIVVSDVSEVGVILRDITVPTSPMDMPQVYGAGQNYTLSGATPPTQPFNTTVVMNVAPTATQIVVVYRVFPLTQLLNMITNNFDYSNLNVVHDRIVAMIQVINEIISRVPQLAQATQVTPSNLILPEPVANTAIGFNSAKALVLYAVTAINTAIATLTGDVTSVGGSAAPTIISANAVSNAKLAQMAALSLKGNASASPANAADLTGAQAVALLSAFIGDSGSGGTKGVVPAPTAGQGAAQAILHADGTFKSPFFFKASSQVATTSSAITSGTFTTFNNSPALTFTPTISGTYKVYSSIPLDNYASGGQGVVRIFKTTGTGTLLYESQGQSYGNASEVLASVFVQSVYTLTAGTNYVFDIQGRLNSGGNMGNNGLGSPFYMFAERVA